MDTEFEDMFKNNTKTELEEIKKKYGTKKDVLQAPKRIKAISRNMVNTILRISLITDSKPRL